MHLQRPKMICYKAGSCIANSGNTIICALFKHCHFATTPLSMAIRYFGKQILRSQCHLLSRTRKGVFESYTESYCVVNCTLLLAPRGSEQSLQLGSSLASPNNCSPCSCTSSTLLPLFIASMLNLLSCTSFWSSHTSKKACVTCDALHVQHEPLHTALLLSFRHLCIYCNWTVCHYHLFIYSFYEYLCQEVVTGDGQITQAACFIYTCTNRIKADTADKTI